MWSLLGVLIVMLLAMGTLIAKYSIQQDEIRENLQARRVEHQLTFKSGNRADFSTGSIFFVGNATVLIRYAGFTILTDPNFLHRGDHVHLGYGITAKRLTNPAISINELPPIDLVVLSHMHEDHFDRLVQQQFNKTYPIVTTNQATSALKTLGFKTSYGLNTWQSLMVRKGQAALKVTAMPGQHGPGILTGALPPVNGHMLEFIEETTGRTRYRLYISGDTLLHDNLKDIPRQFPDIDLALLHLGGTRVLGVFVTMDAEQGVCALQIITPQFAIPIHYNDYDRFKSPLKDFQQAVRQAGLSAKVRYLKHGETFNFHPTPPQ
jgi:L-ascorbate metabolism protein UlaG (beta-lactamase superfamily)